MNTFKILALSVLQTLLFSVFAYLFFRMQVLNIVPDGAAAIGIIGGADGPTAIFVANKLNGLGWLSYYFISMMLLFFVSNLSGLVKNKFISILIITLCCMFAVIGLVFALYNFLWIMICTCAIILILMLGGYFITNKFVRKSPQEDL